MVQKRLVVHEGNTEELGPTGRVQVHITRNKKSKLDQNVPFSSRPCCGLHDVDQNHLRLSLAALVK